MDTAIESSQPNNDPPNQAVRVIMKFGGKAKLADALGHKNYSTVQGWEKSGYIRPKHHNEILTAAQRMGVHLTLEDFIIVDPGHAYFAGQATGSFVSPQES